MTEPLSAPLTRRHGLLWACGVTSLAFARQLHAAPPAAAEAQDQLARIQASRVLRVAVPQDFPPFGFTQHGELLGFDISIAKMLAADLGAVVKLIPVASADRIPALLEDRADLIVSSLGKTPEREKSIDFSTTYAPTYLGVFGQQAWSQEELARQNGLRLGVAQGSLEETLAKALLPQAQVQLFKGSAPLLAAYTAREIDVFAGGNVLVESITDNFVRVKVRRLAVLKESPCYIGMRKNEPRLKARVDKFLVEVKTSGALMVNATKWFRQSFSPDMFK